MTEVRDLFKRKLKVISLPFKTNLIEEIFTFVN